MEKQDVKLYTFGQVCEILEISQHIMKYWLIKWSIKETTRIGGRKVYSAEVVEKLKKMIDTARELEAFSKRCPKRENIKTEGRSGKA